MPADSRRFPRRFTESRAKVRDVNEANGSGRILVVDDEPSIVDAVATALRYEGFDVHEERTGRGAIAAVADFEPDLVVLDWMLPDLDGIEVGRRLRERGFKTAILFLTAKDAVENKVEALRAGGDDYVTKPFSLAEVVARVQAILRRTGSDLPGDVLRFADVTLDEARHEVHRGETQVDLTATEFSLLRYFLLNPRRVLSKGQILQNVWQYDFGGNSNVVETYVSYLRKKLDALGPPLIRTIRQAGYMLDAERVVLARLSLRARLLLGVVVLSRSGSRRRTSPPTPRCTRSSCTASTPTLEAGHVGRRAPAFPAAACGGSTARRPDVPAVGPAPQGVDWYAVRTLGGRSSSRSVILVDLDVAAAAAGDRSHSPPANGDRPDRACSSLSCARSRRGRYRVRASIDRGQPGPRPRSSPLRWAASTARCTGCC